MTLGEFLDQAADVPRDTILIVPETRETDSVCKLAYFLTIKELHLYTLEHVPE